MTGDVTQLLRAARTGDPDALATVVPLVYDQLRRAAQHHRRAFGASTTINTTAVVHEAYAKLAGREATFEDRAHFLRVASRAMRDVIVDYARAQRTQKRGGGTPDLSLADADVLAALPGLKLEEALDLDAALTRLAELDDEQAALVEMRYFAGLPLDEAAAALGISKATASRRWAIARAWLFRELSEVVDPSG